MEPNIDIAASDRAGTIKILNTLLADEYVLYTKSRNYHWNVVSPRFNDLHKFFQAQYEQLGEIVDDVAERVRFLGGQSAGTLREFLDSGRSGSNPSTFLTRLKLGTKVIDGRAVAVLHRHRRIGLVLLLLAVTVVVAVAVTLLLTGAAPAYSDGATRLWHTITGWVAGLFP